MACAMELGLVKPSTTTTTTTKTRFAINSETMGSKFGWTGKPPTSLPFVTKSNDFASTRSKFPDSHELDRLNENHDERPQNHSFFIEHGYSLPPISKFHENSSLTKNLNIREKYENTFSTKTTEKSYDYFHDHCDWFEKSEFHEKNRGTDENNENSCDNVIYANNRETVADSVEKCILPKNCKSSITKTVVPIARIKPQTSVFQLSTNIDFDNLNRSKKMRNTSLQPSSSLSEKSTENFIQNSRNDRKKNRSNDPKIRKKFVDTEKSLKRRARKRRHNRKPIGSRVNDAKNPTTTDKPFDDDETDKENFRITRITRTDETIGERRKTKFSLCNVKNHDMTVCSKNEKKTLTIGKKNSPIVYEDSEMDDNLLVDPSTDLPNALLMTDDHRDETVDLNPTFDIDFHMNFQNHDLPTDLVAIDENADTSDDSVPSNSNDRWSKLNFNENKISKIISIPKKRKSADTKITENRKNHEIAKYDGKYEDRECDFNKTIRITRSSLKNSIEKSLDENLPIWKIGTIVWGNCMGWWPGIIVHADDVGMCVTIGKTWIYWIGEDRISHLRENTQIQKFSTDFRSRMIEILRTKPSKTANYAACLSTIKLVNDEILQRGPLTKPHHAWVEKHLITHENIDRMIVHPYPPNVQKCLDRLRTKNFAQTEKFLALECEKSSESSSTRTTEKSSTKMLAIDESGYLPLASQKPGIIAWAKLDGQTWWPAMIVDYRDCGMKEPNFGCQWIVWYGDYTLSQIHHRFFLTFHKGMKKMKSHIITSKRELYRRGIVAAGKDYCSRYGYKTDDWTINDIVEWFENSTNQENNDETIFNSFENSLPGIPANVESSKNYSPRIIQGLRKHKGNCTVAEIRRHNIKDSKCLNRVMSHELTIEKLCLMCLRDCEDLKMMEKPMEHPFFVGSLCTECSEKYVPTIFAYGDDGKCFFCTICAGSDTVVMCDVNDCPRVYCTACLKYLLAPLYYDEIMMTDPFVCFTCEKSAKLLNGGLLKPREDWKNRVGRLFGGNRESVPNRVKNCNNVKTKLRVLSLFDGISAGLVALKRLGLRVDAYFASEIDEDAETVSSAHFGDKIVRLGDVRTIDEKMIREISPINLLIGGSPCNDLSLVNPTRLGIHDPNGTGILVFHYFRIKNLIERVNNDKHYFWMFENVASMPSVYRNEINQHLGREPNLIDAADYSPQHRPRLYWNNFPTVSFPTSSQDLQDVLTPNCNRHALVKKIRTVTTRVNSLKQGKMSLKPILMNEENDNLWITELEEIFGFERHYTDVRNLSATKRQKLIGKSWSVQTIAELMRPLCNFFQGRDVESS